ncbi:MULTISPECIES: site-2 protease family protein [Haloarcula]|uniref:site-2 protease family protein n=1 Tax=Haloarcula TaxID=2237 RepID=UPI0023ECD87E|nr:site-2 protease family protein [Halomicroarcula sp. XH51]
MNVTFSDEEITDLLVAWAALGVAFTLFLERDIRMALLGQVEGLTVAGVVSTLLVSLLTVGVGFLLHELAHKVVAVRFGQIAAFKADYRMLGFAIVGGLVGFLFAAPGAVVHRGRITEREGGLIALAGPVTNLGLALLFIVSVLVTQLAGLRGFLLNLAQMGVQINLLLAGFNMIPFGPLDGRKVWSWSKVVFVGAVVAVILFGVAGFAVL